MIEIKIEDNRVEAFISALSSLFIHGSVILRGYTASDYQLWDDSCSNPQSLLKHILVSVPDLIPEIKASRLSDVPPHTMMTPNDMAEDLTSLLTFGGCYKKFSGTRADARKLAQSFVNAILGASRLTAKIFSIYGQWTPLFSCIIFETYLVVLPSERQWYLFCATDED